MSPNYTKKLGFKIQNINVRANKIDSSTLKSFEIVIANFQIKDKVSRSRFFQKTFLIANIKFKMIIEMFFLKISNANMFILLIKPYPLLSKSKLLI